MQQQHKTVSIPRLVFAQRNALHPRLRILVPGTARFIRYEKRIRRVWQAVIFHVRFSFLPVSCRIMHKCQICGRVFNRTIPLLYHLKMHKYNHLVKCGLCGRSFCFLATFKLHLVRICTYLHWAPNRICCDYHRWPAIKRKPLIDDDDDSGSESEHTSDSYSSGEVTDSDFKSKGETDTDED